MRKSKRIISLLLTAIMVATTFVVAIPTLLVDADAATTIDGITQERVVGTDGSYKSTYDNYAAMYLNGASSPTNIVIPGLNAAQDYVIQGVTYYPERDWMLVTAYHNDGTESSKIFALDAATGEFVAMFSFLNVDGTVNMDHGGGIAVSEHNIYYSCGDKDRKIAYAPLDALRNAPLDQHTVIQLVAERDFVEIGSVSYDSKTAYSAYVCYDQGVLWMGNFYDLGAKLLGITIAAADYNAPSNNQYNSMIFGYELSGNSSAEEWANLVGATGKDCQGNPSYAIGLDNALKDIQYAVVDNGKLYLSRSYGSGAGNSINFGFGDRSFLTVADIDLSQPGDTPVTISTESTGSLDKTVMAYDIDDYDNYAMMPMSEGLCVVNNKIFVTFEGASNKYMNESSGLTSIGNCTKPVDVVWELDPYELMEITVAEPEKSIYYEKLYSLADIKDGEEYIIVHESNKKDPVTQKNYLYAFNADGNFSGHKLSKSSTDVVKGYDGMIGHPISYYSFEKGVYDEDILYLEHPEQDDIESIRWTITKIGDGKYSIKSTETYFANCDSFYFDGSKITMAPSNATYLNNMQIAQLENSSGYFYFSNDGRYFLWCNDGENATYNTKANAYYTANASNPIFDGVTEIPGTFHCDALNGTTSNILGGQIDTSDDDVQYEENAFQIYRRVVDEAASTYESRVYTDLQAELQEDGTYDVTLETFAISPNHYQYKGERPTDYIIVADTSSSMASKGSTGINEYTGSLSVSSMSLEANTSDDNGTGVSGYGFTNPDEDIYLKHTDGKYYKLYMAVNTTELNKFIGMITSMRQKYYAYYIADDGLYYCIQDHAVNPIGRTYTEWKAWVDSGENESDYSTKTSNSNRRKEDIYVGYHYRFDDVNSSYTDEHVRLDTLKTAISNLATQIAAQNSGNRIALVQYGADANSGFITKSGSLSTNDYANAFWATGTVDQLKPYIDNLTTSAQTNNAGIEFDYVNALIANSGYSYKEDGTRNVAVIFLSDGIPGADSNSATTAAANSVITKALTAKNNGAFVYTVLIGNNEVSGFNKKAYMDGVSSKYAAAASITDLGGQSVDGVNYAISLATTTMNNFVNFGAITTEEVSANAAVGLDNLDANSYLRQQLNDAFKFPADFNKDEDLIVELITGEYDEVGRFSFNEANKGSNSIDALTIKNATTVDAANRTLTVTKYDYSDEYVARNRTDKDGRKLRVTLKGLLADETKKIRNTSINNLDTTGIYKTQTNMNNNEEFKMLPTSYFNIPEYTYVLDYGLPMYDSAVNGTLKSVSADLSAQRDVNGNLAYKDISSNGLVEITEDKLDLIYRSTPTNFADSGYCLIQRDNGQYDWFEIKVVPASNVLFEEDYVVDKEGAEGVAWESLGSPKETYQSITDDSSDVYGYDEKYETAEHNFSNNTASKVSVSSSSTLNRSVPKTFDFVGEGFDLISACGENTGMLAVTVKDKETGELVKGYLVDTYYSGDIKNSEGLICQTPIVKFKGDHNTYTVEVNALYLSTASALAKSITGTNLANGKLGATTATATADAKALLAELGMNELANSDLELVWFDDNSVLNGGTGAVGNVKTNRAGETTKSLDCYIDGFRIYYPMSSEKVDYIASEQKATYHNVIACINDNHIGTDNTELDGIAYVETQPGEDEKLTFANYESFGPQNEFYLKANASAENALVLKAQLAPGSRVQLGLRAVTGSATVKIGATDFQINSATEMYYDVTDCIDIDEYGVATLTIQNTGSGILAVNNVKLTGDATMGIVTEEDMQDAKEYMMAAPVRATVVNGVVTPVEDDADVDNNTTIPGGDVINKAPSFVQELLAKLFDILSQIFTFLPVGEVL
ncbi:MAG: VWA domain-containing protein [Clostridia bacterium]|nr:VWA domain-containing protein [Clostridia bacterium]